MKFQVLLRMNKDEFMLEPVYKEGTLIHHEGTQHYAIFDSFEKAESLRSDLQSFYDDYEYFILASD